MLYQQALELFGGETLNIDCADRKFMTSLVDFQFTEDDLVVRLEISFLETLEELKAGSTGGTFCSIKSGRLPAGLLVDWNLVDEQNGAQFIEFARSWDPATYYCKGSQDPRCLVVGGTITAQLTEFVGPSGKAAAGMVRVNITDGRLAIGTGVSQRAKNLIAGLLKKESTPKVKDLLF